MKTKRTSEVFIIACFIIFIGLAALVTFTKRDEVYSYFENRNLASMPELTADSVLSGDYFDDLESFLQDRAAGRTTLLKANTLADLNVFHRPVVNDVVVSGDILLPWIEYRDVSPERIASQAEAVASNLESVKDLVESYGGSFCYTAVPCQYAYFPDEYPWYLNNDEEYTELSLSYLGSELEARGITYIDMGQVFEDMGSPDYLSSYIDNHYSIYGAYITYLHIMDVIRSESDTDIPVLAEDDFTYVEIENPYLGSRERKLFNLWESDEALWRIEFNNDLPFTRTDGGYESASTVYSIPKYPFMEALYGVYMGGDNTDTVIKTDRPELPSILIYGDSFTNAVESIAYYSFDTMYSLDLRYYRAMSLGEFIEEYKPDYVVCIRDYEALLLTEFNGTGVD